MSQFQSIQRLRLYGSGLVLLFILTSCTTDLPRSKAVYLQQFETLTQVFTERLPGLTDNEFQHFHEQYWLYSRDYYKLFHEKLTIEERQQIRRFRIIFLANSSKYRLRQSGERLIRKFEEYILEPKRQPDGLREI